MTQIDKEGEEEGKNDEQMREKEEEAREKEETRRGRDRRGTERSVTGMITERRRIMRSVAHMLKSSQTAQKCQQEGVHSQARCARRPCRETPC